MRVLAVAAGYPYPGHVFSGVFNERCALVLNKLCERVVVLTPRPYVPPMLAVRPRWKAYAAMPAYECRGGVDVHRPAVFQLPLLRTPFWSDLGAYLCSRQTAARLHREHRFDAIVSFDLLGAGGLAWRLGKALGIPASGWAFGGDVRSPPWSSSDKVLRRTLANLDCVFYQSRELLDCAAQCVQRYGSELKAGKHLVLPHGIPALPPRPDERQLREIRARRGLPSHALLVLSLGRLSKAKGAGELLQAFAVAASACDTLHLVLVGAMPAFDDSQLVMTMIERDSRLRGRVTVRPACSPDEVSDFYYSADIFAFASPREGMPNALLEAMAAGLPAVAFAIPAVKEIDGGEECLLTIPPLDCEAFAHAILRLAGSPQRRRELASKGSRAVRARFNIEVNVERALAVVRALTHADPCLGDTRGRSVGGGMETWK